MDVRLIAATNKDLTDEVEHGHFREDFYYRINVINIHLPPLRERIEDLPLLIQNLIAKYSLRFNENIGGISPSALRILENYDWPGNIRELENTLEHAFVMCHQESIEVEHLPDRILEKTGLQLSSNGAIEMSGTLEESEKSLIRAALKKFDGNRAMTALALGANKTTLWRKMKKYGLSQQR